MIKLIIVKNHLILHAKLKIIENQQNKNIV